MNRSLSAAPAHSVAAGKLFLAAHKVSDFLQVHERKLVGTSRDSLQASLGTLSGYADTVASIEEIDPAMRSPEQVELLAKLQDKGAAMADVVTAVLDGFEGAAPGGLYV